MPEKSDYVNDDNVLMNGIKFSNLLSGGRKPRPKVCDRALHGGSSNLMGLTFVHTLQIFHSMAVLQGYLATLLKRRLNADFSYIRKTPLARSIAQQPDFKPHSSATPRHSISRVSGNTVFHNGQVERYCTAGSRMTPKVLQILALSVLDLRCRQLSFPRTAILPVWAP